jgi:hypothetical protein
MNKEITGQFRSRVGRIMMGLVLAAMIFSIEGVPARADNDHKDSGRHDNGRYEKDKGHDRDRHVKRRHDNRRYDDRGRVYVSPPVIYAPPPPPGIGIFFPPVFIRP